MTPIQHLHHAMLLLKIALLRTYYYIIVASKRVATETQIMMKVPRIYLGWMALPSLRTFVCYFVFLSL